MLTSIAVVLSPRNAVAQTVRASRLDGGSHARFVHTRSDDAWGSGEQVTASAWIRATTAGGTVVYVHGSNDAWFLRVTTDGFLQFGRGTATATSTLPVARNRWVHVAATAYPSVVIFSVDDGSELQRMGDAPVTDDGASTVAKQLWIGARPLYDLSSAFDYLHGDVDLVRVWDRLVLGDELRVGRYDESASPPAPMGAAAPVFNSPDGYRDTSRGTFGRLDACLDNCVPADTAQVAVFDGVLLQALTVPRIGSASAPLVDGHADRLEYDGGEELAVASRGLGAFDDTRLRAVHDDDNAYYFVDELLLDPSDPDPSVAELFFQAERTTSGGLPTPGDLRISVVSNGLADPTIYVQEADGYGGYIHIADGTVEVAAALGGFELSPTLSIEVRVSADRLGPLVDVDGFGLRFDGPTRTEPLDAPEFLVEEDTLTWMPVRYEGVVAPPTRVQGTVRVVNGRTVGSPGYPNADYFLRDGATFIARLTTDADGIAGVNVTLTGQLTIQLATDVCTTCRPAEIAAVTNLRDWVRVTNRSVEGFACPAGTTCNFGEVTFFYRTPIEASTFNAVPAVTPTTPLRTAEHAQGALALRGSGDAVITGTNLHGELVFYAARADCFSSIPTSCPGTEVLSTTPCADGTENCVNVRVDSVAESCGRSGCELWVNDPWARPGTVPWENLGALTFIQPSFAQLYSMGFQNAQGPEAFGDELNLYLAGMRSSYFSVFGCEVPNPFAVLEGLITVPLINISDGTCAGIAAASNMFASGYLDVATFERGALYPAGLTDRTATPGRVVPADGDGIIPRADPGVSAPFCSRARPTNLFGHLRMLHQRQGTARFLEAIMDDVRPRSYPVIGWGSSPNQIFARVAAGNSAPQYILCMNKLDGGHCVVPTGALAMGPGPAGHPTINIVDNGVVYWGSLGEWSTVANRTALLGGELATREPQRVTDQRVDIGPAHRDVYQRIDHGNARPDYHDGTGLYLIPTSVFEGLGVPILSLEGLGDGLAALASLIAFGGDAQATASDGSVLGWSSDGTTLTTATEHGIAWVPATADDEGDEGARDYFALVRRTDQLSQLTMLRREAQYRLAIGSTGPAVVWWLANDEGLEGADGIASTFTPAAALTASTFTAAARGQVRATLGLRPSGQSGVTLDVSAVVLEAGESLEIRPTTAGIGVELRLDGRAPRAPVITLRAVDAEAGLIAQRVVGPVVVPPGARVRVRFDGWPSVDDAVYTVDLDGDGRDDIVSSLPNVACGDPYSVRGADSDQDGIEDVCEAAVDDSFTRLCERRPGRRLGALLENLCRLAFDVNANGEVDLDDLQAVSTCFGADVDGNCRVTPGDLLRCVAVARLTAGGRDHACDVTGAFGCDSLPDQARVCHQRPQCCLRRWEWTQACVDLAAEAVCAP